MTLKSQIQIDRLKYPDLPERMLLSVERYVNQGIPTGGFLEAVLSNSFVEAVSRADSTNQSLLREYALMLYNDLPPDCWGSPEIYNDWIKSFKSNNYT